MKICKSRYQLLIVISYQYGPVQAQIFPRRGRENKVSKALIFDFIKTDKGKILFSRIKILLGLKIVKKID